MTDQPKVNSGGSDVHECVCQDNTACDCGAADRERRIPTDPTAAECVALILQTYKPSGLAVVLGGRVRGLGGRPGELMETTEGRRRVYAWALGLAEGVMG